MGQHYWAADPGPRTVLIVAGGSAPIAQAASNTDQWHFCCEVTHISPGAEFASLTDVTDEITASNSDLLNVAIPSVVSNEVQQLIFHAMIWGCFVPAPRTETIFYAPCLTSSYDIRGGLFVLKRTDSTGYGVHEIAVNMVGTALSTESTLVILPNGPVEPVQPTTSGVGISGPWTFEAQFMMTGSDAFVSFYLSSDRDTDHDAPEVLYHVCLKYANPTYVRWLDKTSGTNSSVNLDVLPKRRWHHIVVSYNGASGLVFYINGTRAHEFSDAPLMQQLDHIRIGPASGRVRELGLYHGIIYSGASYTLLPEGRFNATIAQHQFFGGIAL